MHWLLIDVSGLIGRTGTTKRWEKMGAIDGLLNGMGRVDESDPVEVDLDLTGTGEGIAVSGRASGRFVLNCSRCLIEYREGFALQLDEKFYLDPESAESKDGYQVEDNLTVDLEPMLRDAIVLSLPITPVHSVQCRGLCPVCGADLNNSDCRHDQEPVDFRWAPLKGLIADE
ncbi:MAG: YceD family protein [Actinomycetota bacterium]